MKLLRSFSVLSLLLLGLCFSAVAQQTSAPTVFTITAPVQVPTIATTAPQSISAGAPQFTITVNGTNFQSNSVVQWTPTATGSSTTQLATTFVSATKLTAIVPANLVGTQGTVNITVLNPILSSQHQVNLQWVASTTGGVTYSLYRGTTPGGPYSKIASGINALVAVDANVQNGMTYYYVCTAVDSSGVDSVYSNEASAVIPA